MQIRTSVPILFCALLLSCAQKNQPDTEINLVPFTINESPDYWCTWGAQNYASDTAAVLNSLSLGPHSVTAGYLTEERLFGEGGWSSAFPEILRQDLILLFDLGWDIRENENIINSNWKLGSLEVAQDKFPSCSGSRENRLRVLDSMVRDHGWKGTGLWLPAHPFHDQYTGIRMADENVRKYYGSALVMCKNAGIPYWKIDYGYRGTDIGFRAMITELAEEIAPGMTVEHSRGSGPLNDEQCPWDTDNFHGTGSYRNWDDGRALETAIEIAKVSHVLRTYDITQQLSIPTTLDRVSQVLFGLSGSDAGVIINCEDEPYLGAVLGCALGILRHPGMIYPAGTNYDPFRFKFKVDEVLRAVRWHRIAPAWSAGLGEVFLDSIRLQDSWYFKKGEAWATWVTGREVIQTASARISRGIPLPLVECIGEPPYVVCSKHPNGAISIGTLPRTSPTHGIFYPLAEVTVYVDDPYVPIGIFGRYKSLKLVFHKPVRPDKIRIMGQDLASEKAVELTNRIEIKPEHLIISGELISETGLSGSTEGDLSEPGMVLRIFDKSGSSTHVVKHASSKGKTFYISNDGDDASNGGSPENAWKTIDRVNRQDFSPGDEILFKGGEEFEGTIILSAEDAGAEGQRVLLSSFGEGKAVINGISMESLKADNCDYLTIENLECSGSGRNSGNIADGLVVSNCDGVIINGLNAHGFQHNGVHVHQCDDAVITHVHAYENGFAGIHVTGATMRDPENYDNHNLYIGYCVAENNPGDPTVLKNHSGNGILASSVKGGTIEYCEAFNNGWDMPWTGNGPVGIWIWDCTDFIIQHCIAHHNRTNPVAADGGGFDFDGGVSNSIIQYCISHDNEGAGFGLYEFGAAKPWENNTVRYNISQDDGIINGGSVGIWKDDERGTMHNCQIYNNTFYNSKPGGSNIWLYDNYPGFCFRNNVFVYNGALISGGKRITDVVFQGNLYWNLAGDPSFEGFSSLKEWSSATGKEMIGEKFTGLFDDPLFRHAGTLQVTDPENIDTESLEGYLPRAGSPLIDAGLKLQDLYGLDPGTRDLRGKTIPVNGKYDIGAIEWSK
jgi:hypothetical protein